MKPFLFFSLISLFLFTLSSCGCDCDEPGICLTADCQESCADQCVSPEISSFSFIAPILISAEVDQGKKQIDISVPYSTDLSFVVGRVGLPEGATISPDIREGIDLSDREQDFVVSLNGILSYYTLSIDLEPCEDELRYKPQPFLHYPLNGNGNQIIYGRCFGTVSGASGVQDRHGETNQAMYFDGNDYIRACNQSGLSLGGRRHYTFSAWVKLEAGQEGGTIVSKVNSGVRGGWSLFIENGKVGSYREVDPYAAYSSSTIPYGQFVHVAATFDGYSLRIYINGKLDSKTSFGASLDDTLTPIVIGGIFRQYYIKADFIGTIDDVRIYNRALSQSDLECIANS